MELLLFPKTETDKISRAKPFLKWAGGKTQLLKTIEKVFPSNYKNGADFTYFEPFVGGGAVLFWVLRTFPNLKKAVINDINLDLINTYRTIKNNPKSLIEILKTLEKEYLEDANDEVRKAIYIKKREIYNTDKLDLVERAAYLMFLNRTCFNGLYRVNSKNLFNVPAGRYKNPKICNEELIFSDSLALQKVKILDGDYKRTGDYIEENSFFYFDPPYKPISETSSFNSYSNEVFNDAEQKRLRDFCVDLDKKGCEWLLSNSDPKNVNPDDNFFETVYKDYQIDRVKARRVINSNAKKRGEIFELLISNYVK